MAKFVPYADRMDWLLRQFAPDAEIGELRFGGHAELGAGVFSFPGPEPVSIYELGVCFADHQLFRYEEIEAVEALSLAELMRAQKDPKQTQLMVIRAGTEIVQLRLPLHQYTSLWSFLMRVLSVVEQQPTYWGRIRS